MQKELACSVRGISRLEGVMQLVALKLEPRSVT